MLYRCFIPWLMFLVALPGAEANDIIEQALAQEADRLKSYAKGTPGNAASYYWDAFDVLKSLPDEDLSSMKLGDAPPERYEELSASIAPAMRALALAVQQPSCDWGIDYSRGLETLFPHTRHLLDLKRVAMWEARRLGATDPASGVSKLGEIYVLAGHANADPSCLNLLVSIAATTAAMEESAAILPSLARADAQALSDIVSRAPVPSWKESIRREQEALDHFIERLAPGAATNRSPQTVPGRETVQAEAGSTSVTNLRVSALVSFGDRLRVGIEEPVRGEAFWLSEGESYEGVTLLDADYAQSSARLVYAGQTGLLRLTSREIQLVGGGNDDEAIMKLLVEFLGMEGDAPEALKQAGGRDGLAVMLKSASRFLSDISNLTGVVSSDSVKKIQAEYIHEGGPFLESLLPDIPRMYERYQALEVRRTMLMHAIQRHLGNTSTADRLTDPATGGKPFEVLPASNGYVLVSQATLDGTNIVLSIGTTAGR